MEGDDQPPGSYGARDYQRALNELGSELDASQGELDDMLRHLIGGGIPLGQAKICARDHFPEAVPSEFEYEKFTEYTGDLPPPKISNDDWKKIPKYFGKEDLLTVGYELQGHYSYVTYCLECDIYGQTLLEAQQLAIERLNTCPPWLKTAYSSDTVLYIGYTSSLAERLKTHSIGEMHHHPPPAYITKISRIDSFGVVGRFDNKPDAETMKRLYAENLIDVAGQGLDVFTYSNGKGNGS